jgi:hypothetical protein
LRGPRVQPACGTQTIYLDPDNFESDGDLDIDEWGGYEFFGPGPTVDDTTASALLGITYDSASTTVPLKCGDVRDNMIAEYVSYHSPFLPICSDFMSNLTYMAWYYKSGYSYSELTPDQTTGAPDWAVLQTYATITGVAPIVAQLGYITIKSGYRNPAAEVAAATKNDVKPYMNSRHLAGDAIDFATSSTSMWQTVHDLAITSQGCVEPVAVQGNTAHAHVDWRTKTGNNSPSGGNDFPWGSSSCPGA